MTWYSVSLRAWGNGDALVEADSPSDAMQQAVAEWEAQDFDVYVEATSSLPCAAPPTEDAA